MSSRIGNTGRSGDPERELARVEQVQARHTALVFLYAVTVVLGLALRSPAIVIFGAGCLLLMYLPRYYAQSGQATLTYKTVFSERFAWPGDILRLTVEIENRSFFPISLLQVWDELPLGLEIDGGTLTADRQKRVLQHAFRLGMWQRVRRHYAVSCPSRGVYIVGPTRVDLAGPFGYGREQWQFGPQAQILVYPKVHALSELWCRPLAMLGESSLRSFLHEDPLRLRGVREYTPGDSLNRINWKATAKAARLLVHVHEPSAHISVQLLLNLSNNDQVWQGLDSAETEWAIEVTASLGVALLENHGSVGVSANDYITDLSLGAGEEHMQSFLATLGLANRYALWKPSTFIASALEQRHFGTTLVLVTPSLTEEIIDVLEQAEIRRSPLRVVYTGSVANPLFDDASMLWIQRQGCMNVQ
ncbi:MAG: hypothetical protein DDT20_01420 [Firmicutes bacterium]|nr:hypothetical protein [Bacillota bacterium]